MYLTRIIFFLFIFLITTCCKSFAFDLISDYGFFAGYKKFSNKSLLDPNIVSGFTTMTVFKEFYYISSSIGISHTHKQTSSTSSQASSFASRDIVYVPHFSIYFEKTAFKTYTLQDLWIGVGLEYDVDHIVFPSLTARYYFYLNNVYFCSLSAHMNQHPSIQISFLR